MDRTNLNRNSENVKAHEGGSFRDSPPGRGIYYVIPGCFLRRLAIRYEYGDIKYGQTDAFKAGLPVSDCVNSLYRHLSAYADGDNSEDHLAAIAWNVAAIMYYEENKPQWQDLEERKHLGVAESTSYPLPQAPPKDSEEEKVLDSSTFKGPATVTFTETWKEHVE